FFMIRQPPRPPLFPYTTLFRSEEVRRRQRRRPADRPGRHGIPHERGHLRALVARRGALDRGAAHDVEAYRRMTDERRDVDARTEDRKSTRLNSSHLVISYAVFC